MTAAALLWSRQTLVFDLDGTLVDTLDDLTDALQRALFDLSMRAVPRALVLASLHGGMAASVDAALRWQRADPTLRGQLLARYVAHYAHDGTARSRVFPGVCNVLAQQRSRGARLAVCTNKSAAAAAGLLQALDLHHYFDALVGGDSCEHAKPHPAPLLRAIELAGGAPDDAVLVGDSAVDLACAQAADVACLLFAGGYGGPSTLDTATTFADYAELGADPAVARGHRQAECS